MELLITWRNVAFFSDFQCGFRSSRSTSDLLTYLKEFLGLLTGLGLIELQHLIYPRLLTGFGTLVLFANLGAMELQVRCFALFLLSLVMNSFEWFSMGSLHKNIQLMLAFLQVPFLGLHFSCYTLVTFLMMLSVILHQC